MNILILTGKFGMGHKSSAIAIKEELLKKNCDANIKIVDIVEYILPLFHKVVYEGFNITANKMQFLYNAVSEISDKSNFRIKAKGISNKIKELIEENSADLVISTLPLSSRLVSDYKIQYNDDITLITCITDISWHNEWINPKTNYYCVGAKCIKNMLIKKGIAESNILVMGIPVKEGFVQGESKTNKTNNDGKIKILIMGGGLGIIPKCNKVFNKLKSIEEFEITVITGNNRKLYKKLSKEYPEFNIVGFTDKVDEYMRNSDVLISKPGGITVYEAIHSELPLLIINPFLKQEVDNAHFIEERGIGKVIWDRSCEEVDDIDEFIKNQKELMIIRKRMKEIKKEVNKMNFTNLVSDIYLERSGKRCG